MQKRRVTIKDIAKKLNISVSTVSRALRNAPDINPETRESVLKLVEELDYEPNYFAQSLVGKQSRIIGVVLPASHFYYFSQALSGMTDVATENHYHVMFCQSNEKVDQEIQSIKKLMSCNIDGLLVSISEETKDNTIFHKVKEKGIPIVMFDRILHEFPCSKVIVNEFEGAFRAVEHLIKKGCHRIAHLAGPQHLSVSINRMNGYKAALEHYKIPFDEKLVFRTNHFEEDALPQIRKIAKLKPLPDGVFFVNDLSAVMGIKYFHSHNINVPDDIKVVGFNDDAVSAVVEPALTTVMQPGYEVGKLAMGIVIDEIQNKASAEDTISLRTKLVVRKSTAGSFK